MWTHVSLTRERAAAHVRLNDVTLSAARSPVRSPARSLARSKEVAWSPVRLKSVRVS